MFTLAGHKSIKKPIWLFSALVFVFLAVLTVVAVARSVATATLTVEPPASTVAVGESTTVDVVVRDVADLYGAQLEITFDPGKVRVLDANLGVPGVQVEPGTCPAPDFVVANEVSNATGTISYTVAALNPSPACNGDGLMARVEFEALTVGSSAIHFSDPILANRDGQEILTVTQDGSLTVTDKVKVFLPIVLRNH